MIDRFGKKIVVGFAAHEILWIEAALTLPEHERLSAFQDIAGMTGRDLTTIIRKSIFVQRMAIKVDEARFIRENRERIRQRIALSNLPAPSIIRKPSEKLLMTGRP